MPTPGVVGAHWKTTGHEILVGGVAASSITATHGTPVFVYDEDVLRHKYFALRDTLPSRFSISYSVKANPNPAFLEFFLEKGCGLEVASAGEFCLAKSTGCAPEHIVFAGPGKTEAELELVIAQAVGEIHAESQLEIERIGAISRKLGYRTPVAIRVNPNEEGQGGAMRMGGKSAPFGVDEESLGPVLDRIANDPWLDFRGIHLFVGTQILDSSLLLAQYKKGLEIARRVASRMKTATRTLDFGGGLGIPYFPGDAALSLPQLATGLRALMAEIEHEECFEQTNFIVEPGRFLVAEAGIYIARINDIKTSRGKKYLILDGGMNHHLAASGNLGQVLKRNFPIAVLNKIDCAPTETVDVVGPLCTPLDTLGRAVHLPQTSIGDLIGIFQSGAYARSASPLCFLSHATPPEVWMENGQDSLIRRRGNFEDFLRDVQPILAASQPEPVR
jgi:diaminopimelate decarboxylase